jgi:hypothetical protein
MRKKLMECCRVATVQAATALGAVDERVDQLVIQLANATSVTNQPPIELPEEPQLRANRRGRVPARGKMCGERIDVRAGNSEFLNCAAIREDLIQHVFSIPGQGAVEKTTAGLCRIDKHQIADERVKKAVATT